MTHVRVNTERGVAKSRLRARRHFATNALYIIASAVVLFDAVFLVKSDIFKLGTIVVSGTEHLNIALVESVAKSLTKGSYFGIVPRNHSLFYPKKTISAELFREFPRISDLEIHSGGGVLGLDVREYEEKYLWCGKSCFFMNENGKLFAPTSSSTSAILFMGHSDDDGALGKTPFDAAYVRKITNLMGLFAERDMHVISVNPMESDTILTFSLGWQLKFVSNDDLRDVHTKSLLVLGSDSFGNKNLNKLLYLDLRFGNKAYYKFRE